MNLKTKYTGGGGYFKIFGTISIKYNSRRRRVFGNIIILTKKLTFAASVGVGKLNTTYATIIPGGGGYLQILEYEL